MNESLHLITPGPSDFETSHKFYAETLGMKMEICI